MKKDTRKNQQIFKSKQNPLLKNYVGIYEHVRSKWELRFQIDKANFESEKEFQDFIEYTLDSLNRNCD